MTTKATFDREACALSFPDTQTRLYLDPDDNRAKFLIKKRGVSQQMNFDLWTTILDRLAADAIIDIGANYGEMFIPRRIPSPRKVHLYEANPNLIRYLEASRAAHPDSEAFTIHNMGVSDEEGVLRFNVDAKWSGTSSFDFRSPDGAYKGEGEARFEVVEVPTRTLGGALAAIPGTIDRVAIKIDTEGHEPKVLAQPGDLSKRRFALMMEADPSHLLRARSSIGALLERAGSLGRMFEVTRKGGLVPIEATTALGSCDVLVTNDDGVIALAMQLGAEPSVA